MTEEEITSEQQSLEECSGRISEAAPFKKHASVWDHLRHRLRLKIVIPSLLIITLGVLLLVLKYSFYVERSFGGRSPSSTSIPILLEAGNIYASRFYYGAKDENTYTRTIRSLTVPVVSFENEFDSTMMEAFIFNADGSVVASTGVYLVKENSEMTYLDGVFDEIHYWYAPNSDEKQNIEKENINEEAKRKNNPNTKRTSVQKINGSSSGQSFIDKRRTVSVSRVLNSAEDKTPAYPDYFFGFSASTVMKPNLPISKDLNTKPDSTSSVVVPAVPDGSLVNLAPVVEEGSSVVKQTDSGFVEFSSETLDKASTNHKELLNEYYKSLHNKNVIQVELDFPAFGYVHLPAAVYYLGIRVSAPIVIAGQEGMTFASNGPAKLYSELSGDDLKNEIKARQERIKESNNKAHPENASSSIYKSDYRKAVDSENSLKNFFHFKYRAVPVHFEAYEDNARAQLVDEGYENIWSHHDTGYAIPTNAKFKMNSEIQLNFHEDVQNKEASPKLLSESVDGVNDGSAIISTEIHHKLKKSVNEIHEVIDDSIPNPLVKDSPQTSFTEFETEYFRRKHSDSHDHNGLSRIIARSFDGTAMDKGIVSINIDTNARGAISLIVSTDESRSRWKGVFSIMTGLFGILLITDGLPAELILLALSALYAVTGIISPVEAFSGFGSAGLICLGAFFVIAAALRDTVFADKLAHICLGNPTTCTNALIRMCIPVLILSALLSGPFVVTILIPPVTVMAHRLDAHPGKLLMPLAFLSSLGGMCSLAGSPANLTAVSLLPFTMGVWDLFPICLPIAIISVFAIILFQPILLRSSGASEYMKDNGNEQPLKLELSSAQEIENMSAHMRIEVMGDGTVQVNSGFDENEDAYADHDEEEDKALLGRIGSKDHSLANEGRRTNFPMSTYSRSGLEHLEYHVLFEVTDGNGNSVSVEYVDEEDIDPDTFNQDEELPIVVKASSTRKTYATSMSVKSLGLHRIAGARLLLITDVRGNIIYPPTSVNLDANQEECLEKITLEPGYGIKFAVLPGVLPFLRRFDGIKMATEEQTKLLGAHRRQRLLSEVVIHPESPLCRSPLNSSTMITRYGMVVIGARRHVGPPLCCADYDGFECVGGDVLLVECYRATVDYPASAFSLVKAVPFSKPPRTGRVMDLIRSVLTFILVLTVTVLTGFFPSIVSYLPAMFIILIAIFFTMKQLNYEDFFSSFQGSTLIMIGAAIGVAAGFASSGALGALARFITVLGSPFGRIGMLLSLYAVVSVLSLFLSSCAALAVALSLLETLANLAGLELFAAGVVSVVAANCAFSSPFGLPQSIVVVPKGQYSFGDFVRYGLPIQILAGLMTVLVLFLVGH